MKNDYYIEPVRKSRTASVFYYLLSFLILAVTVGFYINSVIEVNKLIGKNKNLKEKLLSVNQSNMRLKVEIEKLSSYDRISRLASEKFNMVKDDSAIEKKEIAIPVEEKETVKNKD